jgi:hypothetical protein
MANQEDVDVDDADPTSTPLVEEKKKKKKKKTKKDCYNK